MRRSHTRVMVAQTSRTGAEWFVVPVLLALALLYLLAAAPLPAHAASYADWRVSVWPEYDDPRALVIMEPVLDATARLPYEFAMDVPRDAQINMTCQLAPDGQHQCQANRSSVRGGVKTVSYTVPSERNLYFEYYADLLEGRRPEKRDFTYRFVPPADISSLKLEFRQPKDATGFTMSPEPDQTRQDPNGDTFAVYALSDVARGKEMDFRIRYERPSWTPPVAKQSGGSGAGAGAGAGPGGAPAPAPGAAPTGRTQTGGVDVAAVAVAGVVVVGTLVLFMSRRSPVPAGAAARGRQGTGGGRKQGKGAGGKSGKRGGGQQRRRR